VRSQVGASALDVVLQVDTSIHASTGNSADSGAAPYSVSAAFFLVMTSGMVSVTVTPATTLPRIARSTRTATTLPWAAIMRIRMRILGRCINGGLVADPPRKRRWTKRGALDSGWGPCGGQGRRGKSSAAARDTISLGQRRTRAWHDLALTNPRITA
jgi:hypothetical protein